MALTTTPYVTAFTLLFLISAAASDTPPTSYNNHTVGASAGWFFNTTTNTSSSNYSSWAASQTFNLGDFLIFNTNTNQTVIQTYNLTTFKSCSFDDAEDDDSYQYSGGQSADGAPLTISVPLTIEGSNYYFSNAGDGVQCQHGMAFEIQVKHGLGLPPSLNQPPPPPYAPPPTIDSAQTPPVAVSPPQGNGGFRIDVNLGRAFFFLVLLPFLF